MASAWPSSVMIVMELVLFDQPSRGRPSRAPSPPRRRDRWRPRRALCCRNEVPAGEFEILLGRWGIAWNLPILIRVFRKVPSPGIQPIVLCDGLDLDELIISDSALSWFNRFQRLILLCDVLDHSLNLPVGSGSSILFSLKSTLK